MLQIIIQEKRSDRLWRRVKKELTEYGYKVGKISMKEHEVIFERIAETGNRDYQEG